MEVKIPTIKIKIKISKIVNIDAKIDGEIKTSKELFIHQRYYFILV